jgi:hypothetical protein
MLQSGKGPDHHIFLRRKLMTNIAARFRFVRLGRSAAD